MSDTEAIDDPAYVCRHCREPVTYGASKCPHCGGGAKVRAGANRRMEAAYRLAKWVCYLSIIGIPIGIWFRRKQRGFADRGQRGVAVPA